MITAFIAFVAASAPIATPPRPQVEGVIAAFRSECISEAGIAIGVRNWTEYMKAADEHRRSVTQPIQDEVSASKRATPFDIDRYARALKAANDDQYNRLAQGNDYEIKLLRDLPAKDRARWVVRLAREYTPPANYCGVR